MKSTIDKLSLYDKIDFGKYRGTVLKNLIDNHWKYVNWCVSNISNFQLDNVAFEYYINQEPFNMDDYFDSYNDELHFQHDNGIPEEF